MEPEDSLPHSQQPVTCPYPEPDQSNPRPSGNILLRYSLLSSSHQRLGLASGLLPPGLPTKALYVPLPSPIRALCPARLFLLDLVI